MFINPEEADAWVAARKAEARAKLAAGNRYSPETKAKMAEARRARWLEPEYRAKFAALQSNPEYRAKRSRALIKGRDRPELKAKHLETMRALWADPVHKAKMAELMRKRMADPENKKAHAEMLRNRWGGQQKQGDVTE